ncbi:hypothetical protein BMF94_0139 [Rhodotorula taiwanensis]|uniref:Uncharacterized protein n=1 Tax=Rhodotorula taiwanensis TaxID=741276 RepID=A0A2S5BJE1_9BASI|nr:hypothetical protein BMF94_0139 [Rhodotorula taiwanensis]
MFTTRGPARQEAPVPGLFQPSLSPNFTAPAPRTVVMNLTVARGRVSIAPRCSGRRKKGNTTVIFRGRPPDLKRGLLAPSSFSLRGS